ncbi:auxin-responsive protein SAUR72-like [Impatiens glandulifera]|uniref:auxin-responsive protein SAUR72-like n=1 Tax=Impatiens glandulifera TaxID=253017 RepID=UPI001FB126A9|nr:auxin-responsive protein SAUR72-like [Impatiens glandulifera]
MDPQKQSNKIAEIVKLRQLLKKWRKRASSSSRSSSNNGIGFLKRTLSSLSMDNTNNNPNTFLKDTTVPKGFVAIRVGDEEMKRFVVPMEYLSCEVFSGYLLKEAEEVFGFQQEGVLKIPCKIHIFEMILKAMEDFKEEDALMIMREYYVSNCSRENNHLSPSYDHKNHSSPMCK